MTFRRAVLSVVWVVAATSAVGAAESEKVPDTQPFNVPYGPPIRLEAAQKVVAAAQAEARRHNWNYVIAVVDPSGNLIAFARMDGTELAANAIAQAKALAAVRFRRPTKVYQDQVADGNHALLSVPGVVAAEGGLPLIVDGQLIGAIGTSGGAGAQDSVIAQTGASALSARTAQ